MVVVAVLQLISEWSDLFVAEHVQKALPDLEAILDIAEYFEDDVWMSDGERREHFARRNICGRTERFRRH